MTTAAKHTAGRVGFDNAKASIATGDAKAHPLWVVLANEHQRDGYALKPMPWEGAGEYQRVSFDDGRDLFVRIPYGEDTLPTRSGLDAAIAKAEGGAS